MAEIHSQTNGEVMTVFTMTKLDKVFPMFDDESRAIAALEKKGWFS